MAGVEKLLITENKDFSGQAIVLLEKLGKVVAADLQRSQMLDNILDATILWIRLRHQIDKQVFDAAPKLKYIVTPTTGLNHIDMERAEQQGVTVLSLRGEVEFLQNIRA
jgi:D-3-phosphoglycerate dehydrogenase